MATQERISTAEVNNGSRPIELLGTIAFKGAEKGDRVYTITGLPASNGNGTESQSHAAELTITPPLDGIDGTLKVIVPASTEIEPGLRAVFITPDRKPDILGVEVSEILPSQE